MEDQKYISQYSGEEIDAAVTAVKNGTAGGGGISPEEVEAIVDRKLAEKLEGFSSIKVVSEYPEVIDPDVLYFKVGE